VLNVSSKLKLQLQLQLQGISSRLKLKLAIFNKLKLMSNELLFFIKLQSCEKKLFYNKKIITGS
jgi:hypothetical protein